MYYIRTADRLTRTSVWLEKLEGGLEHVRDVVLRDSLGLGAELERQMQGLVDTYVCEWAAVVNDPVLRARFKHFANSDSPDPSIDLTNERGQIRPVAWPEPGTAKVFPLRLPLARPQWLRAARVEDVPVNGGVAIKHGEVQLALYNFAAEGRWYATQNNCPHTGDMVLARGILGDQSGEPKVACPIHKKTFSLKSGQCLSGESLPALHHFPTKVEDGWVYIEVPPPEVLAESMCKGGGSSCEGEPKKKTA
jgi:nitrite reductase (NADH) large subunit